MDKIGTGFGGCTCMDALTYDGISEFLTTRYIGREIINFDTIDSTNNIAREKALKGCPEGLVVTAETQVSGRGRMGRSWVTPKGTAIAFSLVLRPNIKPCDVSGITLVMGTVVCRALNKVTSLKAGIKWPNDIVINKKKVCGILTEMNANLNNVNYIVVGVGINVNIEDFPDEIKDVATSLKLEMGEYISRRKVLSYVLSEFESLYENFKEKGLKGIMEEYKSLSVTLGNHIKVSSVNEIFEGEAVDITEEGALLVRLEDGTERKVLSGDVSVRGIAGYV